MIEEDPYGHNLTRAEHSRRKILIVNLLNFEWHRNIHVYLGRHLTIDRFFKINEIDFKTTKPQGK